MNLLFSMSLAGSLVLILYFITKPATRYFFPASWRYQLLKVSLLFYLLPYQYLKYIYVGIWRNLFPSRYQTADPQKPLLTTSTDRIILVDSDGHFHFENQTIILTLLGIWGFLVIAFLLYHIIKYTYCMKNLRQLTKLPYDLPDDQYMPKRRAKAKVSLYANHYITTPFTLGLFSPRIILPDSLADRKDSQMIIAHEMAHARNHDNLIKFLCLLAMLPHWYNPAIYILYWEICKVSEQVCDASVIKDMSKQEKKQYQLLIIELSQKKPHTDTVLASPFSGRFRMIKERITVMNKTAFLSKKIQFIASLIMAVVVLALSPVSVLAYSPAPTYEFQDEQIIWEEGTIYSFPEQNNFLDIYDPFQEYGTAHDIFVANDGQVYILNDTDPQMERVICLHDWQDGKLYNHVKNDDGSCVMYCYDCQHCSLCGANRNLKYNSELRQAKCSH